MHKADYVNLQVEFTETLTNLANELKNLTNYQVSVQSQMRREFLLEKLCSLNEWLEYKIRDKSKDITTASKCYFHAGIVLPIESRVGQED